MKYGDLGQRNDCRKSETGDEDNDDDEQVYFIALMTILIYTFPQKGRLYTQQHACLYFSILHE